VVASEHAIYSDTQLALLSSLHTQLSIASERVATAAFYRLTHATT
jgi:hypothetical protein